jgi:hypothetical protein
VGLDRELRLELANRPVSQDTRVQRQGLGSSIAFLGHGGNIGE